MNYILWGNNNTSSFVVLRGIELLPYFYLKTIMQKMN